MASFAFYIYVPILIVLFVVTQRNLVIRYLLGNEYFWNNTSPGSLVNTPLTAAIVHASLFYIAVTWVKLLPRTFLLKLDTLNLYMYHAAFLAFYAVCCYCLYQGFVSDPGYIRKASSVAEKNASVTMLAGEGNLDARHFCVTCSVS
jgi:palmitoyltransferase ZDHHC13/17